MAEGKLGIEDAVAVLSNQAEGVKKEIENRDLSKEQLEELYSAEKSVQNREDVKKTIESEIKHIEVSEVLSTASEDIEVLESALEKFKTLKDIEEKEGGFERLDTEDIVDLMGGDISHMEEFLQKHRPKEESLEELLEAEKKINNREQAISLIKEKMRKEKLEANYTDAEKDIESLEESVERLRETSDYVKPETEEQEENSENNETEEVEEQQKDEGNEKTEKEGSEEKESNELSRKETLIEELDLDLSNEEKDAITLEKLESIKEEKEHRKDMIEELEEKKGMSEEELRKASTDDLERIVEEVEEQEENDEEEESSKSKDEMREEAEEDLQMLMGAGSGSEDEEDDSGPGRIEKISQKLGSRINTEEEDEEDDTQDLDRKKLDEILNKYRELPQDEAVVKTAHVMKSFIERNLDIERELTYRELSEEIPEDTENLQKLSGIFKELNKEQYTQNINIGSSDFIETCEDSVDDLER